MGAGSFDVLLYDERVGELLISFGARLLAINHFFRIRTCGSVGDTIFSPLRGRWWASRCDTTCIHISRPFFTFQTCFLFFGLAHELFDADECHLCLRVFSKNGPWLEERRGGGGERLTLMHTEIGCWILLGVLGPCFDQTLTGTEA